MMKVEVNETAALQNLEAAGCDEATISAVLESLRQEDAPQALRLLAAYRRSVLEGIHREQKQLDKLDYLVYQLEKTENAEMQTQKKRRRV